MILISDAIRASVGEATCTSLALLLIDTGSTFFWAINTGVARGVLTWWAVVSSGADVLGCIVAEPIHTSGACNRITHALAARELAILARIHLSIKVLIATTLLGVQVTIIIDVLSESSWAEINASIWRH